VTTPALLEKKRDTLQKFVRVQIDTWKYIYDGNIEEGVQAILAQRPNANLDPDVLRGQLEAYRAFFESPTVKGAPFGRQYDSDWEEAIKSMQDVKMVADGRQPSDYYTNELLAD